MDLFELLLLFVFFVLPLFQALIEQRRKAGRPPLPPPEDAPELPRPAEGAGTTADAGWSTDWGSWPGIETDEDGRGVVVLEEAPAEVLAAEETSAELPAIEAVRVADPVVSLEQLHVDRSAERARLLARHAGPAPATARAPRAAARIRSLLGERGGLRRAVLLAEVLGPPRALNADLPAER